MPIDTCRISIRLPRPRWIFEGTVVLVATSLTIRVWLLNSWNKRTVDRFLVHARQGDIADCRAMLAEGQSKVWLLDAHALRIAANRPLAIDAPSFVDFMNGRQRFRADIAYANDHSLTVEKGRVTLGSAFWIKYIPPGPEVFLNTPKSASTDLEVPAPEEFDQDQLKD
jgi:hypothetical protein